MSPPISTVNTEFMYISRALKSSRLARAIKKDAGQRNWLNYSHFVHGTEEVLSQILSAHATHIKYLPSTYETWNDRKYPPKK